MKLRLWVLIVVLIGCLLAIGFYITWSRAGFSRKIESLLVSRLSSLTGARVEMRDFQLGPGYARFGGLLLADEDRGLHLRVDHARLSFSLADYILGGFRFSAGLKEVLLSSPQLEVTLDRFLAAGDSTYADPAPLREMLLKRITMVRGSILFSKTKSQEESELTDFDGWLEMSAEREGSFRCTGSWGARGEKNLLISGSFDHRFEVLALLMELRQADLKEVLGPILSNRHAFEGGLLQCSLGLEKSRESPQLQTQGQFTVEVDTWVDRQLGIRLEDLRVQARLEEKDLVVETIEAAAQGGRVQAQGRIVDLLSPVVQLQVEARGLQVAEMLSQSLEVSAEQMPHGLLDFSGRVEGSGDEWNLQGRIAADQLQVSDHLLMDLAADLDIQNSLVEVRGVEARLPWADFRLQGKLDLAQSPASLEADWSLQNVDLATLTESLELYDLQGEGVLTGRLMGPVESPLLRGGLQLTGLSGGGLPVDQLSGQFHWEGGRLSYRLGSPEGRLLLEGGSGGWSRDSAHQGILKLCDLPLGRVLPGRKAEKGGGKLCGRWMFSGTPDRARLVGEAELKEDVGMSGRFDSWAEYSRQGDGQWRLEAGVASRYWEIQEMPMTLNLEFSLDDRYLSLQELNVNDQLQIRGAMERDTKGELRGQMICSQLDMRWLSGLFPQATDALRPEGRVSGLIELSGTRGAPGASGELTWTQGRLGGLDQLSLRLPVHFSKDILQVETTTLNWQGREMMRLSGQVSLGGDMFLEATGEQVEAATLARLLGRSPEEVDGKLNLLCQVMSSTRSPTINGQVQWTDGRIGKMVFDDFKIDFRGTAGLLNLKQFSMETTDRRSIWASGSIPYAFLGFSGEGDVERELDLSIGIKGDVLSLLPVVTSVVEMASGDGEAAFRLGGSPGSLVLGNGRVYFDEGWIQPTMFLQRVENLQGRLEIDEEDHFVEIGELQGTVDGRRLRVVNFRGLGDQHLEPVIIPGLELNLGIVGIETGPDGIEANIPGLMAPEERGQIRLTGKGERGPLLIAGPLESPQIEGALWLNHMDFTYPPYSAPEGTTLDFLAQVRWDLEVVARKDVWYKNDFANLRVRDTESKLHFLGSAGDVSLRVSGRAEADRGEVTYLDRQFQVVELELDFEGQRSSSLQEFDNYPLVTGRFQTTVYSDSTGDPTEIYLTLYTIDEQTGERTLGGRWGDFKLDLSSNDPSDDRQEKILAKLGYTGDYADKALQLLQVTLGPKLENYFIRPVLHPVEETLKRTFGIDVIRFQPGLTRNLLIQDEGPAGTYESLSRRLFLPHSTLLIGKYLTDKCFLSYLGQFRTRTDEYLDDRLGIVHCLGLEYRISGGTILDVQYDYERDLTEGDKKVKTSSDKRVQITHRFPF